MNHQIIIRDSACSISILEFSGQLMTDLHEESWRVSFPQVPIISRDDAIRLILFGAARNVKLVDMRTREEYRYDLIKDIKLYKITNTPYAVSDYNNYSLRRDLAAYLPDSATYEDR